MYPLATAARSTSESGAHRLAAVRTLGLAVVIAIAMAGTAKAATFETAKRVSQTAVGTADRDATDANVAATTFGWFAAWDSDAALNGVDKLYGQRLDLTGAEVGGDTSIPSPSPSHELSIPDVAYDHERDRVLVVARGKPIGVNRIYATLLNASTGAQIGSELEVSTGSDFNAHAAYSAIHDEYLVVFEHTTGTGTDRLFARRISADGGLVGTAAKEISQLTGQVRWNDVEALTAGGWIATWTQDRAGEDPVGGWDVHAQVLAPSGATLAESGTDDRQISPDGHNARNSVIARDPATDTLLAVWEDTVTSTGEINARILNPDGSSPAAAFALSTTGAGSPREPDVAGGRPGGGWLVTWETGESFRRIATQEVSGAGAQVGEDLHHLAGRGRRPGPRRAAPRHRVASGRLVARGLRDGEPGRPQRDLRAARHERRQRIDAGASAAASAPGRTRLRPQLQLPPEHDQAAGRRDSPVRQGRAHHAAVGQAVREVVASPRQAVDRREGGVHHGLRQRQAQAAQDGEEGDQATGAAPPAEGQVHAQGRDAPHGQAQGQREAQVPPLRLTASGVERQHGAHERALAGRAVHAQ